MGNTETSRVCGCPREMKTLLNMRAREARRTALAEAMEIAYRYAETYKEDDGLYIAEQIGELMKADTEDI